MFVLCDVSGRFEVLDTAVCVFLYKSDSVGDNDGLWFYLKMMHCFYELTSILILCHIRWYFRNYVLIIYIAYNMYFEALEPTI